MNASMNDSHNLIWKITQVLRGWADISLLKTYEFERRKYAQDLIDFDKKFSTLFSGKPRTAEYQDGISHEEFLQVFQTFGGFTSGIGIHYAESPITNLKYQSHARNLVIGERLLPQIITRAADARPYELQDLLPVNARFKILVFAGDTSDLVQRERVHILAARIEEPMKRFTPKSELKPVFDFISISTTKKEVVNFTDMPKLFRAHWSQVFTDDTDVTGRQGGKAYATFGIAPCGAIVIVRPDGYVGMVAPFDAVDDLEAYFASFLKVS